VGDGSPGSREAEGEGGEGFHIAQSGRVPRFTCKGVVGAAMANVGGRASSVIKSGERSEIGA
jgi:hypothetical protein